MATHRLPPTLEARYQPERLLGAGGAGHVVLAQDTQLGRPVAVKVLSGRSVIASASRFLSEAQALSRLSHPNILEMYDYGVVDEVAYLVLEYVQGGSLDEWLGKPRRHTEELRVLAGKILAALAHAHGSGVIHRDLKPANVLLTLDGEPKLADFGLAKHSSSQARTASGLLVGTPEYMAPEIFRGGKAGSAVDLYAWGCLLHALEFGRPPWEGELSEIVKSACVGRLTDEAQRSEFREVYRAALAVDPVARSDHTLLRRVLEASAPANLPTQMQQALRPTPAAAHQPVRSAVPATVSVQSSATRDRPPPASSRLRPLAFGMAGLAIMGGGLWAMLPGRPPPAPPVPARSPERIALEWRERLEAFVSERGTAREVQKLHAGVYGEPPDDYETYIEGQKYPGGERHQAVMYEARVGTIDDHRPADMATPDLEALGPLVAELPYREDFAADRDALVAFQSDTSQPFRDRLELHHAVQALEFVDAYVQAWGGEAPYQAAAVTRVLAPVRVARRYPPAHHSYTIEDATNYPRPTVRLETLGEEPLSAGDHLLYHWALEEQRRMPFIFQDSYNLSHIQQITMSMFKAFTLTVGDGVNHNYKNVAVRVDLGERPRERFSSLRLRVTAGNCIYPDALRISWNDLRTFFRAGSGDSDRWSYVISSKPEYDLVLDLPPETWQAGENQLVLRVVSVPGINHRQAMDVFEVRLDAKAKEGT
jgi:serine/threonine protein kinase